MAERDFAREEAEGRREFEALKPQLQSEDPAVRSAAEKRYEEMKARAAEHKAARVAAAEKARTMGKAPKPEEKSPTERLKEKLRGGTQALRDKAKEAAGAVADDPIGAFAKASTAVPGPHSILPVAAEAGKQAYGTAHEALANRDARQTAEGKAQAGTGEVAPSDYQYGGSPTYVVDSAPGAIGSGAGGVGYAMTPGGWQPGTRSSQTQTERKEMPPAWGQAVGNAAQGQAAQALGADAAARQRDAELLDITRRKAEADQAYRQYAQQEMEREAQTMAAAREQLERLNNLIFQARPDAEWSPKKLIESRGAIGAVGAAVGGVLSMFGAGALRRGGNSFVNSLKANADARYQQMEAEYQAARQRGVAAERDYDLLAKELPSSAARRAFIEASYLQGFKSQMEETVAKYNMNMNDPRLAGAFAEINQQLAAALEKTATHITQQASETQKYVPPQVYGFGGGGRSGAGGGEPGKLYSGLSEEDEKALRDYEAEREKRGILQMEGAVSKLARANATLAGKGITGRKFYAYWAAYNAAAAPGNENSGAARALSTGSRLLMDKEVLGALADVKEAQAEMLSARGGKALTGTELRNFGDSVNMGDLGGALNRASESLARAEGSLRTAFPAQHKVYWDTRTRNANVPLPTQPLGARGESFPQANR